MCPLWPLHLIILYLLALGPLWVVCQAIPEMIATFNPKQIELHMGNSTYVTVNVTGRTEVVIEAKRGSEKYAANGSMPISFGLSYVIFPDSAAMRLGMFCVGVSPAGGASNIWTYILGGNLNLSLAMTSICTIAAFAFMPAWLFSLGQVVFRNAKIVVPYARIATFVVGLIVPLAIGLAMQRFMPKVAAFMVRILKGFSSTLLLFIIVFAIVTNLYIFKLFTWQVRYLTTIYHFVRSLQANDVVTATSLREQLTSVEWNSSRTVSEEAALNGQYVGRLRINGVFLDSIFTTSVAVFVSLIFINFGCAMHWPTVKEVIKKPIGPAIGMCGQFLVMPLLSFGLGYLIFPDDPELHLGLFFTGVSPAGGASNIWTFILGGNLNLSLAMTSISTIGSFAFMPAWLFSLGQVVFANANIVVPYARIGYFVVGLTVPLGIGLSMQKFTPKLAIFMVKILKCFSTSLLIFIITFAIITNLYIFELFSWRIVVAGMGLPWLGYLSGYAVARILRQPHEDALAISIETGVQNMGIAVFLLRYALPQPEADLTTVVPVSVSIMTPFPMLSILLYQKIKACVQNRNRSAKNIIEDPTTESDVPKTVLDAKQSDTT
ncbi:unnamed protein product [Leptidea sinapis]|nr:unnamed protein product [Leptidea sinapis]